MAAGGLTSRTFQVAALRHRPVEAAIDAAATAAAKHARWLKAQGVSLPHPQTYEEVRHYGNGWAAERGIDWSHALASVVKLPLEE